MSSQDDLETAALHDLVSRMKRFRRRVALPVFVVALLVAWLGMAAHALGYWSVLGTSSDGRYLVSAYTMLFAGVICAAPVLAPGVALYALLRAGLRRAWRDEHREKGVSAEWLGLNSRRFG